MYVLRRLVKGGNIYMKNQSDCSVIFYDLTDKLFKNLSNPDYLSSRRIEYFNMYRGVILFAVYIKLIDNLTWLDMNNRVFYEVTDLLAGDFND